MSKTFRDQYFIDNPWTKKKEKGYQKQKRQNIKNKLKNINIDDVVEDDDFELEDDLEEEY